MQNKHNTRKALVLGGKTGLLGQALVTALAAANWEVFIASRPELDPLDFGCLEAFVNKVEPAAIFNTVAWTNVDKAEDEEEEAYRLNRSFPSQLGRLARQRNTWLMHFSTDFVFNGKKQAPYTEEDKTAPLGAYGESKLAGEQALLQCCPELCCIVRTAWLFGPGRQNFITAILNRCANEGSASVVHDQVGSPTYTPDLAEACVRLAEIQACGIVHVVNSGEASWCEFASKAVSMAGMRCPVHAINSAGYPQKAARPAYSVLSTSRYTALTGHTMRPWPQALQDYVLQVLPQKGIVL